MTMRNGLLSLALVTSVLAAGSAHADHLPTVKVIDADQLKTWIDQGKKMVVIDSRVAAEYREAHIITAINIPDPVMDKHRDKLPRDLDHPLVFYCNGWPECKKSHNACDKAVRWGYREIHWFRDGIPAWQAKGYPIE